MKKRKIKKQLWKIWILILGIPIILLNCQKEDSGLQNQSIYQTVSINEALSYFNSNKESNNLSKSSENSYITINLNTIYQEELINSSELLTLIEAKTVFTKHYSRILLLKINGKIESVVFSMYPSNSSNNDSFSGEILITDLEGTFLNGFRVKGGKIVSQFIKTSTANKFSKYSNRLSNEVCEFHSSNDPDCILNTQYLDEVVISGNRSNDSVAYISVADLYGGADYIDSDNGGDFGDESWNYGGGGSSSDQGEPKLWYLDNDGDGYHSSKTSASTKPEGNWKETTNGEDCDDTKYDINNKCDPTPCETALLARDVYSTVNGTQEIGTEPIPQELSGGWELNSTLDLSEMSLTDVSIGFNSAVYQKWNTTSNEYEYMYVTEGTTLASIQDWINNIDQLSGNSSQYETSVTNAEILHNLVGNNKLYFTGHSLGGGLASANSLATGRSAYTYNAAALGRTTRNKYNNGFNPYISATIVKGEFLDEIQKIYGFQAEGIINYIDEESSFWQDFFNERSPAASGYKSIRLHAINAIIDILDCE